MGFLGKASEFFAAPGASVGGFLGDALHNVSNYACQLHYNTPGVIFDVSPFNRELWREFCKDRPAGLPETPKSSFSGGQCDLAVYTIHITRTDPDGVQRTHSPGRVYGPVGGARFVPYQPPSFDRGKPLQMVDVLCRGLVNGNVPPTPYSWQRLSTQYVYSDRIDSLRVERSDGGVDNCGDMPPPRVEPVVLPVSQRTTVINIRTDQSYAVTAIVEFPSASVDFNLSVPLRVTIDGRQFHLNVDGWHVGFPSPSVSLLDVEKVLSDNVLQFEGTLNQYFAPINPSINSNLVLVSPSTGKKKGGEEKDIPGAQWLIWDLTRLPDKAQYGENSPTVYFAGWFSFYKEGRCMERRQINYERGIVRFPDGADGYGYTFTNGAEGDVSVYKEKPQDG